MVRKSLDRARKYPHWRKDINYNKQTNKPEVNVLNDTSWRLQNSTFGEVIFNDYFLFCE